MKIISSVREMRDVSFGIRASLKTIGFVPTMGCLHEGHISLVRSCSAECDLTVVSVFVNPTQFGPGEDFEKYPRNTNGDISLLKKEKVDVVFVPGSGEMYPEECLTYVDVTGGLTEKLCAASRPGHFRGVATVVAKLFNIVDPDRSYFGQKDAQQALVIRKMASDLNFRTDIRIMPTVRESDGLAMSSRNKYLSADDRRLAALIFKALQKAAETADGGERKADVILKAALDVLLLEDGIKIDYAEVVDAFSLESIKKVTDKALLVMAVFIGKARLIDNIEITVRNGKDKK